MSTQAMRQAEQLRDALCSLLHHEGIAVRSRGAHLIIDVLHPSGPEPTARITSTGPLTVEAAFRNHRGRWEPLPDEGTLDDMATLMADILRPYLTPH